MLTEKLKRVLGYGSDLDSLTRSRKSRLSSLGLISPSYQRLDYLNLRKDIEITLKTRAAAKQDKVPERFFHQPTDYQTDGIKHLNASNQHWTEKKAAVNAFLDRVSPKRILDLGIADAWLEEGWTQRGIHTLGLEGTTYHYQNSLSRIRALGLDVELIYGDIENPFTWTIIEQYPSFDLCYIGDTIEHFEDPDFVLGRAAKRCSSMIVTTPVCNRTGKLDARTSGDHIWEFDEPGLRKLLERVGFQHFIFNVLSDTYYVLAEKQPR